MFLALCALKCHSDKLCFTFAQTDYEQLYCEIKAQGKGTHLPAFYEFQRNNVLTQALLLKGPARNIGVDVVMPNTFRKKQNRFARTLKPITTSAKSEKEPSFKSIDPPGIDSTNTDATNIDLININSTNVDAMSRCHVDKNTIRCLTKNYQLIGNRSNDQLDSGVFSSKNIMDMPVFSGALNDIRAVDEYLQWSYAHYLNKMLTIGLGGSTLSYGKFAYLFDDLTEKKISFTDRFEKMYFYLKRDKQQMRVNTRVLLPNSLSLESCYPLLSMLVCAVGTKNYVFLAQH